MLSEENLQRQKLKKKTELLPHLSNDFLKIFLGGRLLETKNKRIHQISGQKSGRGCLRNLSSGRLRDNFWNSIWLKYKNYLQSRHLWEVAAYKKCSLGESWLYSVS